MSEDAKGFDDAFHKKMQMLSDIYDEQQKYEKIVKVCWGFMVTSMILAMLNAFGIIYLETYTVIIVIAVPATLFMVSIRRLRGAGDRYVRWSLANDKESRFKDGL